MQLSLPLFLESINLIDANSEDVYIEGYDTYKKIGYYLLTLGQPKEALRFLKDAEKTCPKDSPELAALWDNIANNYIKTGNYAAAKMYLKKALDFSRKINDEVRYAKVLGNMALINSKEGKSQLAIEQLLEDIQISEKNKSDQNTMYALTLLSKVYLEINDVENAEKSALKALEYAKSKPYFKTNEYDITEILVKTAQIKNHEHDELLLRRKADELKEITDKEDSHDAVSEVNWIAQKELVENRLNMVKAQSDRENLLKNISYILVALLLVIFFLIHFLSKRRKKSNDQEYQNMLLKLKLDNLNAERKLDENQKTILSFNMSISQKNSQIEFLEKELIKVENSTTSDVSEQKSEINELLKTHLMTKENWDNFKQAFIVDEPEYYSYIQENFDDLTDSNLRLVILMKLKLDNKQIAQVLGITQDAVKKAKQRLHKKLSDKYDALLDSHYNQN
jgi:preprotein translocase subunit SecG